MDHRRFKQRTLPQPSRESEHRHTDHHRHKNGRDLVHQTLNGRFGGLRVFHQTDDVRQHRFLTHGSDLQGDAALAIDGRTGQPVADGFGHRLGFAGQHGLVHLRLAFQHHAVDRHALAGEDHQTVAHQNLDQGHIHQALGPEPMRPLGSQRMQGADGRGGLLLGARLQPLAEQHQGHHRGRAFKIQMRHAAWRRLPPQPHRQQPTGRRAQGHQQIHVAAHGLQGLPTGFVKARTQNKLHRRGQSKLQPGRPHQVHTEQLAQHRQHQGQ